jgi:hypothetical protein
MNAKQIQESLRLLRNELDRLPIDELADDRQPLINCYAIVYKLWNDLEEGN